MRRKIFKTLLNPIAKPVVRWYLSRERVFRWKGITIKVPPGVFHPGLFYSTRFMLSFLDNEKVYDRKVLEIGAGSGLISIFLAKEGAVVTATDISPLAVKTIKENAALNKTEIRILESDLFQNLDKQVFDLIIINPPYYKGSPQHEADLAWKAGENLEYFQRFFGGLQHHVLPATKVFMVLSEDAELESIKKIAAEYAFSMTVIFRKNIMLEWHFIFNIQTIRYL